jgi:hypothetical protein
MSVNTKNKLETIRRERVRQLFTERHPQPTGNDVLIFYGWLHENFPDLLPKKRGDSAHQHLKVDLHGLYEDK